MRVGVNCCFLFRQGGGIGQYFARLMNRLLAGPDEYVLFHLAENVSPLDEMLVPAWRTRAVQVASERDIGRLLPTLDLYFCPAGKLFPRPAPVASVVTLVDVQEAYFPQFFTFRDRWFRNYHHPASTQLANRVITISEFSRQAIARAHRIPPSKIDVVHLAPDETAHDSALVEGMSLPSGLPDRFLFYPANVWPHKNHDRLLAALTVARQRYGVVLPCVLTGAEVPNGSSLKNLIASHQLADQVLFLGYQPAAVVAALYRRATALVFPSLFEGFGLPVVEAMAAGCPVVCSSTTSLPEVAAGAAVYVNPEDPEDIARQLVTVWRDHQLRRDLSEKGKRRAQRFSVDAMADAHRRAFSAARDDFAQRGPQHYPRYLDCRDLAVSAWRSWYIRSGDAPWPWR